MTITGQASTPANPGTQPMTEPNPNSDGYGVVCKVTGVLG